jgi:hypothetical protein
MFFSILPDHQGIRLFVNSDALYLPSLYRDLFADHSGLRGWHLNSAPTFFPEMFLYFPMMALLKGTTLTSLAYGLVQILLMMLLTDRLLLLADRGINTRARYLITFSFMLFPLSVLMGDGLIIPSQLFLSGYHSGSFIISLLAMICALEYLHKGTVARLILIGVITFLAVISDKLFIMSFVAPVFFFSLIRGLKPVKRTRYLVLISVLVPTTILGLMAFQLIDRAEFIDFIPVHSKMFQFQEIPDAFRSLFRHLWHVILIYPFQRWLVLASLVFMLGAPVYLIMYLRPYMTRRLDTALETSYNLTLFLWLFVFFVLFTPVINGYYRGASHIRYNFPALILGTAGFVYLVGRILSPMVLPSWFNRYFTSFCTLLLCMILLVWGIKNEPWKGLRRYVNHYPEPVRILDELKEEHGLKYGLAGYWQAKYSTNFSRNELRIYSIRDKSFTHSSYHAHNENWYFEGGKGRHANPVFNFLETSALSHTEKLKDLFGKHMDTLCMREDLLVIKVPDFKIDRESGEIHPILHKNLPFIP